MKIGYFGIPGSFTHTAAADFFPGTSKFVGAGTFNELFKMVKNNKVAKAVLPIENTLSGSIYENYDLLDGNKVFIVGETYLKVQHHLMVNPNSPVASSGDLKAIKKVYSHPKALEQCSDFFKKHSWIAQIPYTDTSDAAKLVSQSAENSIACIAGHSNARIHNLKIIAKNLESNSNNHTRFIVIANKLTKGAKANKCTVEIGLPHVPGSLSNIFAVMTANRCNLTKIESRPIHGKPFEYIFYLDFLFDPKKHDINKLLTRIKDAALSLRLLGIYNDTRPNY